MRKNIKSGISGRFTRILQIGGMDSSVVSTLTLRLWSIIAGGITAVSIPIFLDPIEQGYFYTFTAVIGIQILFELGLNNVLIQLTSHAAAHLRRQETSRFVGDARWQLAILSLVKISTKWNGVMAILFFGIVLLGGTWFFSTKGTLTNEYWLIPWSVLVGATAINLGLSARLAICEGLGEISQVAKLRLFQSIIGYGLLWCLLIYGAELWAVTAIPLSCMVCSSYWLHKRKLKLSFTKFTDLEHSTLEGYRYHRDVFPLQWRIAVSWACGYFIFNFLTPVVFAKQGVIDAGRLGLAMTLFSAILTVGMSWISAKVPLLASCVARNERVKLNNIFDKQAKLAIIATIMSAGTLLLAINISVNFDSSIQQRLPSLGSLILLAISTGSNAAIFAMASYVRAHKHEPFLAMSITTAIVTVAGVSLAASHSLHSAIAAYATITSVLTLPWCYLIYKRYRAIV